MEQEPIEYNVKLSDGSSYKVKSVGGPPSEEQILNSLKSMGHTTNSVPEPTGSDKPTNEPVVKASATASGASESEAKARGDSDSIPAKESRSNGNVVDSGSPNQDNIIKPEEHESLLSKGWKLLDNPLVHRIVTGDSPELEKLRKEARITSVQGPELMKIPGTDALANSIRNKGRNSGNYALGFGSSVLGDLIDMAGSGFDPRNAATKESPMDLFPVDHLPENVPENTPIFRGHEVANASEQFPESIDKEDALSNRPDLVANTKEDQQLFNDTRTDVPLNDEDRLLNLAKQKHGMGLDNPDIPNPPTNISPIFNGRGKIGETGIQQNKPRLLLNADGSFINKETGEMFDMRGHKIDPSEHKPGSLIDMTDQMNNKEITHDGGSDNQLPEPPNSNESESNHKTTFSDIINLPKALKASFDLSAPGRQGLGLIHTKEWWTAWNDMFKGLQSDEAFKATQQAINNRPLFKSFGDEPSFAQKVGLKLTNLGKLDSREESFMSGIAEKFPGVKPSERAYTAYLNKLRADTFENLMSKYKVLGENGEYNIPLAKELANYINNATGRGSLGALESSAVALNNAFFSPRFFASRLKLLGEGGKSVFTPSTYVFSQPNIRREYLKSLLAIAGVGTTIGELAKLGGASVEHDPTNSDFMKIKVGNTRIDPYAGMQQPVVLASRLLSGKSTSSTSGKTTDLSNPKYGQSNRMDVIGRFARSKESPALSFAHGLLAGKDNAGKKFDVPEEVVNLFVPMVLQDLKSVATENPNLIPYLHEQGLGFENTDVPRSMLAIPGVFGASIQNYSNSKSN